MVTPVVRSDDDTRVGLRDARVLCCDTTEQGAEILSRILIGFGVHQITRSDSAESFKRAIADKGFDLILIDAAAGGDGFALAHWLRRSRFEPNRYVPVVILAGHTPKSQVERARDSGANSFVTKPISAAALLDRILWIGRGERMFVETDTYVGPDRRFKNEGPPNGLNGRRSTDLSAEVGMATVPNMSQAEIDALIKPQKVSL